MRAGSCRSGVNAVFTDRAAATVVVNDPFMSRRRRRAVRSPRRGAPSVRSRPRATSVSNSGGVAVSARRRDADRHEQVAGLPAARLDELAQRRLELVGLPGHRRRGPRAARGPRRGPRPWSRRPSAWARGAPGRRRARRATGSRRGRRSRRASAAARGRPAAARGPRPGIGMRSISPLTLGRLEERQQPLDQVVVVEAPDPLPVDPLEPLAVEPRAALLDLLDLEPLLELGEREHVLLRAGRPAEEREVVDERLLDEALRDVVGDGGLALALAHLGAVGVEDQRQVAEHRLLEAQRLEQQDVLGRVADVVLAADHVADGHRGVVDHHGEVVERRAVGADDDEVAAEVGGVDLDPVADQVVPADDAVADAEPHGGPASLRLARGALLGRQVRAAADVAGRLLRGLLGLAVGIELVRAAVAGIGGVGGEQPLGRGRVVGQALHLAVRRVGPGLLETGHARALVPRDPEPVEAVEDVLLERLGAPRDVGVLEAQHERATGVPGEQVVEQRRPRGPDVERPRGARRDADADRGGHGPIVGRRAHVPDRRRWRRPRISPRGAPGCLKSAKSRHRHGFGADLAQFGRSQARIPLQPRPRPATGHRMERLGRFQARAEAPGSDAPVRRPGISPPAAPAPCGTGRVGGAGQHADERRRAAGRASRGRAGRRASGSRATRSAPGS